MIEIQPTDAFLNFVKANFFESAVVFYESNGGCRSPASQQDRLRTPAEDRSARGTWRGSGGGGRTGKGQDSRGVDNGSQRHRNRRLSLTAGPVGGATRDTAADTADGPRD